LHGAADILLLSTYELGHQPHHLASPLGFLERAGFHPRAVDLALDTLPEDAVRASRFVGISVPMHTALRIGAEVADRVRALNPRAHICFYGLYAPLHRAHLLQRHADSVLGGEYEAELVALITALERGEAQPKADVVLERLAFAAPARHALPVLDRYAHLLDRDGARIAGYTEASRGCLHGCRHCPIPPVYHGRFFVVPHEVVLADIDRQVAAGARHITLGDPDFFNGPGHAMRVVEALKAAHPDVTFDVTIKVEHLLQHRALLPRLGALGCAFIVTAVESLSDRVLALLDKGHTRADVELALELTRSAGIPLRPSLVSFTPFTSLEDYLDVLDWIERQDLIDQIDPIQLAIRLLVPPGSRLLELDELRAFLGPLDADRLTYTWQHPDPRMDALYEAVFAAVERAAERAEASAVTLARIRALTEAAHAGLTAPGEPDRPPDVSSSPPRRPRTPRLEEPWFC
jgi:radical SAM superfamily enzyme YgiQ (UPF0313 family)